MAAQSSLSKSPQTFITEVEIEGLFNLYSYKLSVEKVGGVDLSRLLILYGDNGSGKTTLLKLIFNLLSPAEGRNHRTFLANTPFRRFVLRLGTETLITIKKINGNLLGAFQATIVQGRKRVFDETIGCREADDGFVVPKDNPASVEFAKTLADFDITLYYLSDDRKTQSSRLIADEERHLILHEEIGDVIVSNEGRLRRRRIPQRREQNLEIAIRRLERWLRSEALKGSSEGEANTNNIYADIVKRIARARGRQGKQSSKNIEELLKGLREIQARSKIYSEYALITPLQIGGLVDTLEAASTTTKPIIASVLSPYVDGLRARLDALQEVQKLIETFIGSINSFFHNKTIAFDLSDGIQITSKNGDKLSPKMLSSGESQILLLFCNTITARDQASIFIIDEPELSLNIKWQRKLLDILINCTKDSAVQFIVATHSVELLTRHKAHVLRLINESRESYV